jgi:hypothetical protein
LIKAFKVCVNQCGALAVSIYPLAESGKKGGKEPALVQEIETRSSRSRKEELLYLFVEP